MSWQATAWAEKQKTGSPARKVLLLVLANYADENGLCWPSQATLAEGTEQSIDTVQRQLRKLEADGHILREKRLRAGGQWPGHLYLLNMATEPQFAVRSKPKRAVDNAATEPQALRPGRAATRPVTGPQALRHEYPKNIQSEYPAHTARSEQGVPLQATEKRSRRDLQELQRRVVHKLGGGDVAEGWVAFGLLTGHQRAALESLEGCGELSAERIAEIVG